MHLSVSVVIPTYNRAHLISRAVESALAAIGPEDEVIVVDDGSTDDTAATVEAFGDRVRLLREPHAGAGPTRNAGVRAATSDLIALLDSDDEWFADKIELQRHYLEAHPEVLYVFSDFGVRVEDGPERRKWLMHWLPEARPIPDLLGAPGEAYSATAPLPAGRPDFEVYVGDFYLQMMKINFIPSFTLMVRRGPTEVLVFPSDQVTGEDWQAYGRLAGFGTGAFFDTETAWQHGHSGERLTGVPSHYMAEAWLTALDRVWGQDETFLAANEAAYRRARADANVGRADFLVRAGHPLRAVHPLFAGGPTAAMRRVRHLLF